jgi:hypothetical protein
LLSCLCPFRIAIKPRGINRIAIKPKGLNRIAIKPKGINRITSHEFVFLGY